MTLLWITEKTKQLWKALSGVLVQSAGMDNNKLAVRDDLQGFQVRGEVA